MGESMIVCEKCGLLLGYEDEWGIRMTNDGRVLSIYMLCVRLYCNQCGEERVIDL